LCSDGARSAAAADAEWKIREEGVANAGGAAEQDCGRRAACDDDPGQAKNCATPHDGIITNDPDGRNARLGEFSKCVATLRSGLRQWVTTSGSRVPPWAIIAPARHTTAYPGDRIGYASARSLHESWRTRMLENL
jgi:hypothetical protein